MIAPKYVPYVLRLIYRQKVRSALTLAGVAAAMFLFGTIQAIQAGTREATERTASENTLVVYRENRFCPFTSRLPENYQLRIERIPGVVSATPMKVVVNNCRTSLDVITYRGVPPREAFGQHFTVIDGSRQAWLKRSDAAMVGQVLAERRRLKVGDRFSSNGVTVTVTTIIASPLAQDQNVSYVHLDFLQRSASMAQVGVVTQFNVRIEDPKQLDEIAAKIDAEFKDAEAPTHTSSERSFTARAAGDLMQLIGFTWWVGVGCVAAVLALVANTILIGIQARVRDHAVLQTLGFGQGLIARLIISEGILLSLLGGLIGTLAATAFLRFGHFSLSNEGLSINFEANFEVWLYGMLASLAVGALAGLAPAWVAARSEIAASFRMV